MLRSHAAEWNESRNDERAREKRVEIVKENKNNSNRRRRVYIHPIHTRATQTKQ